MSYIQIEIGPAREVVKGEAPTRLRGLKFNQMTVVVMSQKIDQENYSATVNYAMIYAGLCANCYQKSQERDFTFEQVVDWVDELSGEVLTKVFEIFQETQAFKSLIPAEEKETLTKKKRKNMQRTA